MTGLLSRLPDDIEVPQKLVSCAKKLDKHYIPSRYPSGFESGIPADYYTEEKAGEAVENAKGIVGFREGLLC